MQHILGEYANKVAHFWGGAGVHEDVDLPVHSSTPPGTISNPRAVRGNVGDANENENNNDDDDIDDVLTVAPPRTRKRSQDPEDAGLYAAQKRLKASTDERRLTGDYHYPRAAQPLWVPRNEGDVRHVVAPSRRSMGGFKPMNTLHDTPHASARPKPDAFRRTPYDGRETEDAVRQRQRIENASGSRDVRVILSGRDRDQSGDRNGPAAKRQKVTHVDLTDDPIEEVPDRGRVMGSTQMRASPVTVLPGAAHTSRRHRMFEDSEQSRVNEMLNPTQKKPRKVRDPSRASPASSRRSSVAEVASGDVLRPAGSYQKPFEIDDDSQPSQAAPKPHSSPRRTIDQTGVVPLIDLGKGIGTQSKQNNGDSESKVDPTVSDNVSPQRVAQRLSVDEVNTQMSRDGKKVFLPPSVDKGVSFRTHPAQNSEEQEPPSNLRHEFHREQDGPRQKMRHRMLADSKQVSSRVSPIDDSFESVDELQGDVTIGKAASRSISPQKPNAPSRSPSDLPRTTFARSQRKPAESNGVQIPVKTSASSPKALPNPDVADKRHEATARTSTGANSCKLLAFYAVSCVLQGGDLELKFDSQQNVLYLYKDGVPEPLDGRRRPVSLGQYEVRKIFYSRECHLMQIDGSVTDVSNGKICIAFRTWEDLKKFQDLILPIVHDNVQIFSCTRDGISKRFNNQTQAILQAAQMVKRRREQDIELQLIAKRHGRQWHPETDAGHRMRPIAWHEEQPRQKLRSQMQSGPSIPDQSVRSALEEQSRDRRQHLEGATSPFFPMQSTRRSTRQANPIRERVPSLSPERWTVVNKPKRWPRPVVYPAQGVRRVTVDFDDLSRLDEGQYFNDNVVSFALRQIEDKMTPESRDLVHFFNSFFYTSLSSKNGRRAFNYEGVKRWTKNKDIFNVPYIVVPICLDLHWFVAIICNLDTLSPESVGRDNQDAEEQLVGETDRTEEPDGSVQIVDAEENKLPQNDEAEAMCKLSLSDRSSENVHCGSVVSLHEDGRAPELKDVDATNRRDAQAASSNQSSPGTAKKGGRTKKVGPTRTYDPERPVIITLDSFGSSHVAEIRNLKDYIIREAETKRGMQVDRAELQGITAKGIPEQTNFCDCGVYLVGYAEQFARDPKKFVEKVTSRQLDRQADFTSFSPSAKRAEIRNELLKLQEEQEAAYQAEKKKKAAGKSVEKAKGKLLEATPPQRPHRPGESPPQRSADESLHKTPGPEPSEHRAESKRFEAADELDSEHASPVKQQEAGSPHASPGPPVTQALEDNDEGGSDKDEMLDEGPEVAALDATQPAASERQRLLNNDIPTLEGGQPSTSRLGHAGEQRGGERKDGMAPKQTETRLRVNLDNHDDTSKEPEIWGSQEHAANTTQHGVLERAYEI